MLMRCIHLPDSINRVCVRVIPADMFPNFWCPLLPVLSASTRCVHLLLLLLFLWLFPSCRLAGITGDISSPHRPVRLLARSHSSTFQISLTRVFPSCFRSSSLPFPWYIRPQHFPQYVHLVIYCIVLSRPLARNGNFFPKKCSYPKTKLQLHTKPYS